MGQESVKLSARFPVSAERIYQAWLDGKEHGAFTGAAAEIDARVGGAHSAWDGYIQGTILELSPGRRIVKSWRTEEFPEGSPDSRLEILLTSEGGETEVTLIHTEIPEGQGSKYEAGWADFYFEPMQEYFAPAKKATPKKVTPKKATRRGGRTDQ